MKFQIAGLAEGADEIVTRGDIATGRSVALLYLKDKKLLAVDAINKPRDFVFGKKAIQEQLKLDTVKLSDNDVSVADAVA